MPNTLERTEADRTDLPGLASKGLTTAGRLNSALQGETEKTWARGGVLNLLVCSQGGEDLSQEGPTAKQRTTCRHSRSRGEQGGKRRTSTRATPDNLNPKKIWRAHVGSRRAVIREN